MPVNQISLTENVSLSLTHTHTHTHTREYYSAIKKNKILPFATILMEFQDIMLSEISQRKTNIVWAHLYVSVPGGSDDKESSCKMGDLGLIPGLARSSGERKGYSLQYSGLENSMDRGAWQAAVHGIAKNWTWLGNFHFHSYEKSKSKNKIPQIKLIGTENRLVVARGGR